MWSLRWSNATISNLDPDYSPTEEARAQALGEMMVYAHELAAERRKNPTDDLATVLTNQLDAGELTPAEFGGYVILLFVAGNETTQVAMIYLAANRDEEVLSELVQRVDRIEMAGDVEHVWSSFINGIKRLPVTVHRGQPSFHRVIPVRRQPMLPATNSKGCPCERHHLHDVRTVCLGLVRP